jgi:hypothetical protein
MVEIAISLAVVAFALVAILGVLPTGLRVQRDNREETIVNADGAYLLEALRTGNDRLGLLSNSVYFVRLNFKNGTWRNIPNDPPGVAGQTLLGLLGTPKSTANQGVSNVVAWVRALNSPAIGLDPNARDVAFRYQLVAEIQPFLGFPPGITNRLGTNELARVTALQEHLYEVRLTMGWPLYNDVVTAPNNARVGSRRRTFRALLAGSAYTNMVRAVNNDWFGVYYRPSIY